MVTAPHHLASQAGLSVLREGGNAIEAIVAAAAAIAVVYPHMNAIGGDGFWLISTPGGEPIGIDASGAAGRLVNDALYRSQGLEAIPSRGPLAANTVAGTISGWHLALKESARWNGRMSLERLLEDAIHWAEAGVAPTEGQRALTQRHCSELQLAPGFCETFLVEGAPPGSRERFRQPRLAATLRSLAKDGLDSFYRGNLARQISADLARAGSPLLADDLAAHEARFVSPLAVRIRSGTVYNMPPPTQGLAALMILGLFDRLRVERPESFSFVHGLVECTKQAFLVRDSHVTDPAHMSVDPSSFLAEGDMDMRTRHVDRGRALPWPSSGPAADTVWMGAIDGQGRTVSFIQSVYWEFGSGVVLGDTGILWQNRGSSFGLQPGSLNFLQPGRKPFHTLCPSHATLADGRTMVYGTMGGEGQPQTQAAVFARHAVFGMPLQEAITAPRWLLGRTWGAQSTALRLESRFDSGLLESLRAAGHAVQIVDAFDQQMGHAGAIVRHPDGVLEGASDPRSDGCVSGF
jgi:gamma-glutamyltranspeptidase